MQILFAIALGIPIGGVLTLLNIEAMEDPLLSRAIGGLISGIILIGSVYLAGRFVDRRSFADFGQVLSRKWWLELLFGLALGAGLMLVIFLIELAFGWVTITETFATRGLDYPFGLAILGPLVLFVAVGYYEELFSRGYQLTNMAEGLRFLKLGNTGAVIIATIISSAIFGILHAGNPNATFISTLNISLAGVFLGLGYILTKNIAMPIGLHITWNFFQGNVFGFPVSGTNAGPTFIAIEQGGPALWTGGQFGPEAGLMGISAMIVGSLLTWLYVRATYDHSGIKGEIADYPIAETTIVVNDSEFAPTEGDY